MVKQPIPGFLSHLKVTSTGYVIPFFVAYIDGKPDFRILDSNKYRYCLDQNLCAICGKKNTKDALYFITGPLGLKNGTSTDAPMHKYCAEYSLKSCPHLYLQKADRRDKDIAHLRNETQIMDKPDLVYLVKAKKYSVIKFPGGVLLKYTAISSTGFTYVDGILKQS